MLKSKLGLSIALAIVPLAGFISLAVGVAQGDPVARLVAGGAGSFFGLGAVLTVSFGLFQRATAGRKINWKLVFAGAFAAGMLIGLLLMH